MREILIIGLLFTVLGCESGPDNIGPQTRIALDTAPGLTSAEVFGVWGQNKLPLNLKIADSFDNSQIVLMEDMANEWEVAADNIIDFFNISPSPVSNLAYTDLDDFYDNEMGIYYSANWYPELGRNVLAITQYFGFQKEVKGKLIVDLVHGDIIINFRDHRFSNNLSNNSYDLPSVVLHELGHLLGLPHERNWLLASVMQTSLPKQYIERQTYVRDREVLQDNYIDLNSSSFINALTTSDHRGELVKGIIELRADGSCVHKVNEKILYQHQIQLRH